MKQLKTKAIILSRTDFGEADRIFKLLTPESGKINVIAKGVKKPKSKLAAGMELLSESEISYIVAKSQIYTLTSARPKKHFADIVKTLEATEAGFGFIKKINQVTDDQPGEEYYYLLLTGLENLNNQPVESTKIELWFYMRLLWLEGLAPNLASDTQLNPLSPTQKYLFDFEAMAFAQSQQGVYNAAHIKLMRIAAAKSPKLLLSVETNQKNFVSSLSLVRNIFEYIK